MDADDASRQIKADKINVSVSRPASTLLDAQKRQLPDLIRASVHYFNDEREVGVFIGKIGGLLGGEMAEGILNTFNPFDYTVCFSIDTGPIGSLSSSTEWVGSCAPM